MALEPSVVLETFLRHLQQGKALLEEKERMLTARKNFATSEEEKKSLDKKIKVLHEALHSEPAWAQHSKHHSINSMIGLVCEKLKTKDKDKNNKNQITYQDLETLASHFRQTVTEKIIKPLKVYDEERPFLNKVKEWASDSLKRLFGKGTLSTKGSLKYFAEKQATIFRIGLKKSKP